MKNSLKDTIIKYDNVISSVVFKDINLFKNNLYRGNLSNLKIGDKIYLNYETKNYEIFKYYAVIETPVKTMQDLYVFYIEKIKKEKNNEEIL